MPEQRFGPDQVHNAITRYDTVPDQMLPFDVVTSAAQRIHDEFEASRAQIAQLKEAQFVDTRTGLLNNAGYMRRLDEAIHSPEVRSGEATVETIVIDADQFKAVNDTLGHPKGDELIGIIANVVSDNTHRASDVLAHGSRDAANLGGDEFAIVSITPISPAIGRRTGDTSANEMPEPSLATVMQDPFAATLNTAFRSRIANTDFETVPGLRLSAGRAVYQPGDTPESLYYKADVAMFANKYGPRIEGKTNEIVTPDDYANFLRDVQGLDNLGIRKEPWIQEVERKLAEAPPAEPSSI